MAIRTKYWVSPHGNQWKVQREGANRASNFFPTKAEAVQRGVELAKANKPSQLFIQRANGTIEDERTYGDDPFPPRG